MFFCVDFILFSDNLLYSMIVFKNFRSFIKGNIIHYMILLFLLFLS